MFRSCLVGAEAKSIFKRIKFLPNNNVELYLIDDLMDEDIPAERQRIVSFLAVCNCERNKINNSKLKHFGGLIVNVSYVYDISDMSLTLRPFKITLEDHVSGISNALLLLKEHKLNTLFMLNAMRDRAAKLYICLQERTIARTLFSLLAEKGIEELDNAKLKQLLSMKSNLKDVRVLDLPLGVHIAYRPNAANPYVEQGYSERMFKFAMFDFYQTFEKLIKQVVRNRVYKKTVSQMLEHSFFANGSRRYIPKDIIKIIAENLDEKDAPVQWISQLRLR